MKVRKDSILLALAVVALTATLTILPEAKLPQAKVPTSFIGIGRG